MNKSLIISSASSSGNISSAAAAAATSGKENMNSATTRHSPIIAPDSDSGARRKNYRNTTSFKDGTHLQFPNNNTTTPETPHSQITNYFHNVYCVSESLYHIASEYFDIVMKLKREMLLLRHQNGSPQGSAGGDDKGADSSSGRTNSILLEYLQLSRPSSEPGRPHQTRPNLISTDVCLRILYQRRLDAMRRAFHDICLNRPWLTQRDYCMYWRPLKGYLWPDSGAAGASKKDGTAAATTTDDWMEFSADLKGMEDDMNNIDASGITSTLVQQQNHSIWFQLWRYWVLVHLRQYSGSDSSGASLDDIYEVSKQGNGSSSLRFSRERNQRHETALAQRVFTSEWIQSLHQHFILPMQRLFEYLKVMQQRLGQLPQQQQQQESSSDINSQKCIKEIVSVIRILFFLNDKELFDILRKG